MEKVVNKQIENSFRIDIDKCCESAYDLAKLGDWVLYGSEKGFPNLAEATGYTINTITGEGTVLNAGGLHGVNCRHSHQPWFPDMKNLWTDEKGNPIIDPEESIELYELQQEQRAEERAIRQTKRELNMKQTEIDSVAETDVKSMLQQDYDRLAYKLREQNKIYNKFCSDNNLVKQGDRLKVSGFSAKDSSRANGRATKYSNIVKRVEGLRKDGIMNINLQLFAEKDLINQSETALRRGIRSHKEVIELHNKYIDNPTIKVPDFYEKDLRYQQGLVKHWKKEIRNSEESINSRIEELKKRGLWNE